MTLAPHMRVLRTPAAVRRQVRAWRQKGQRIAFVPTMGFFHDGHLSLMRRARRHADRVVVSLFVNPTQFGPAEDFTRYPRNLPRDLALARSARVDLCFVPGPDTMYASDRRTEVHVTGLEHALEGAARPTHFAGVALVVLKLLHIVEPDVLLLGQKDAQQAVVLERMIRDLDLPVKVVRGPIVREHDGLAMSSRNVYLKGDERRAAAILSRALRRARAVIQGGERRAATVLRAVENEIAREPGVRLDYVAAVNGRTLAPVDRLEGRVLIPLAAFVGRTRLIDNLELTVRPLA
jgi:pantoate--beta-alanine ligase